MDLTSGTRATATAAVTVLLGGLALTLHGVWRDQATHSLAGVVISMIALTAIILTVIHKWITDTRAERTVLAATQREAQAQRDRYFTAQVLLENEQGRLARDWAMERARHARDLMAEREAMRREFDEKRDELIAETMEATVLMYCGGKFAPDTTTARLIHFPKQDQQAPATGRARSREHGVVGP